MQCEVEDFILSTSALSSPCLDLSRKAISDLPEEIAGCKHLQCLYLEGNCLKSLPPSLFSSCPNLRWLDLRNNRLTHLPSCIRILRGLKTLLLQGNQLTCLPPELGELQELSGLSLASNPLCSPPASVVQRGTRAVLHYLRDQLARRKEEKERGKERRRGADSWGDGDASSESGDECAVKHLQPIKKAIEVPPRERTTSSDLILPLVLQPHLKQAHIHPHPSPSPSSSLSLSHPHRKATHGVSGQRGKRNTKKRSTGERVTKEVQLQQQQRGRHIHVQPLSSEEKLQANIVIEKQRSKESLEQWRTEAREDHLRPSAVDPGLQRTSDTTPYATDNTAHQNQQKPIQSGEGHDLHSILRPSHDEVVRVRVQQYNKTLQGQRRQAGLIAAPSSDLLMAERKLAEALAQQDLMEDRRKREYRLTAFTADPNLL